MQTTQPSARVAQLRQQLTLPQVPAAPLFDLAQRKAFMQHALANSPPPRTWVVENLIPTNICALWVGQGGIGKSFSVLVLGVSVALRQPLIPEWVPSGNTFGSPQKVIYVSAEDDDDELHRRLAAVCRAWPSLDGLKLAENFIPHSGVGTSCLITEQTDAGQGVQVTNWTDQFLASAQQVQDLGLVILDPVSRFSGGDENSSRDMTRFVEQAERIRKALGCTVLLVHHGNKQSFSQGAYVGQAASRGSSALVDGVRCVVQLTELPGQLADKLGIGGDKLKRFTSLGHPGSGKRNAATFS